MKEEWPTPGRILYGDKSRKLPPMLRGSRCAAFTTLYRYHYSRQSEQAHQRAAAVSAALLVDDPSSQWNPGYGESVAVSDALLFVVCIISELAFRGRFSPHPRLKELWVYLRELSEEATELWDIRYQALLK
jgi:hypothetical protein